MQKQKDEKQNRQGSRVKLWQMSAAAASVALVVALVWLLPVRSYLLSMLEWTRGLGALGGLVIIVAYIAATVLFVPGSVLTLGSGFLFGVVVGTVWASIGSTLEAAAAFLV